MTSKTITVFAPAKLNLFLHITGRLQNGYHTLESLVTFANIGDTIQIENSNSFSFHVKGPFSQNLSGGLTDNDNLVVKAAKNLAQIAQKPLTLKITLTKNLPVSSGIGGGSADAAATLWGLCDLWDIPRNAEYLPHLMTQLGADVPVCFKSMPQMMRGIGDDLSMPPDMPDVPAILINPMSACSTETVFLHYNGLFKKAVSLPKAFKNHTDLIEYLKSRTNDLYAPALKSVPAINNVIQSLESTNTCLLSRMSGSGATCFGLFETMEEAKSAAKNISADNPDWWIETTWLNRIERY